MFAALFFDNRISPSKVSRTRAAHFHSNAGISSPTVAQHRLLIETDACPNRLVAHVTLDDLVALDVGKVCFAVGRRKG